MILAMVRYQRNHLGESCFPVRLRRRLERSHTTSSRDPRCRALECRREVIVRMSQRGLVTFQLGSMEVLLVLGLLCLPVLLQQYLIANV